MQSKVFIRERQYAGGNVLLMMTLQNLDDYSSEINLRLSDEGHDFHSPNSKAFLQDYIQIPVENE
jgi:hypothetical protein